MVRVAELNYVADSASRFQSLLQRPWSVMLDSGRERVGDARFDILSADPHLTLTTRGATTEICSRTHTEYSDRDPLALLQEQLGPRAAETIPYLPFSGGAIGYLSYDLGRRFEALPTRAESDIDMPDLAVGIYDWAVVVDHMEQRSWLVGQGRDERTFAEWDNLLDTLQPKQFKPSLPFEVASPVRSNFDWQAYQQAFRRIKEHIHRGDCYQVNLTQRFAAKVQGSAWQAYLNLRQINPAPFSAYLDFPDGQILCSSPERFLALRGDRVETKPIKGTRPRSANDLFDRELAEELRASAKDRAENVMIVDLLRNDLGKVCVPGSIEASRLYEVESFASVHHLVSTVTGQLDEQRHAVDLLRACFPGGSITGAPKLRAMQIIESLEPQRRSVYCGTIAYIGFDGNMDSNIAIRTLLQHEGSIYAWAGGGVVADSEAESEYQESLDKAAALLAVLNEDSSRAAS